MPRGLVVEAGLVSFPVVEHFDVVEQDCSKFGSGELFTAKNRKVDRQSSSYGRLLPSVEKSLTLAMEGRLSAATELGSTSRAHSAYLRRY